MGRFSLALGPAAILLACALAPFDQAQASIAKQENADVWLRRAPTILNPKNEPDNTTVLTAAGGSISGEMSVRVYSEPKHAWVAGFDGPGETITWTVKSPEAAAYHVTVLIETTEPDQQFRLAVNGKAGLTFTIPTPGWQRFDAGALPLAAGTSALELSRIAPAGDGNIKSLELVPERYWPAYQQRVQAFRRDQSRFSSHRYGLMFQNGGWSYPRHGDKGTLDQIADGLDVEAIAQLAQDTGASYVIWSATWITYEVSAPIRSIDAIAGDGGLTARRDVIGDLADALSRRGIDLYLYYHTGQGTLDPRWWAKQQFPREFTLTGTGDRRVFFDNWEKVITEMGERYGTKVQGWFFDDGLVYYPAPFERMGKAARAGNPQRFVSYNPWIAAKYTDFEDVSFGEACKSDTAPIGADGRFVSGPEAGLAAHCMVMMESAWGIYQRDQDTGPTVVTIDDAVRTVRRNSARKAPTSFNMLMYSDGEVSPESRAVLLGMKQRLADEEK